MAVPRQAISRLQRLARQVGGATDDTVRALAKNWISSWNTLTPAWRQAVVAIVAEYERTGTWPASWQIARIEAVARAQEQTRQTLTALVTEASGLTQASAAQISALTANGEPGIIAAQLPHAKAARAAEPQIGAALRGRQARIVALHAPLAGWATEAIRLGLGRKPGAADAVRWPQNLYDRTRSGFDSALVRASTIARTELVDTYRGAAGLVHEANARALDGWCWYCRCDLRSCPACWAMHGRTFPLTVAGPEGHGGCRCTPLPLASGSSLPTAEARFRRLSRRDQKAVLGPARWELWHSGDITWSDLAVRQGNRGWRDTYVPRSVTDLRRLAGVRT